MIIKAGDVEGRVGLKLASGAFLRNEIEDLVGSSGMESPEKVVIDNTIPEIVFGTDGNSIWSKTASSTITVSDNLAGGDTATYNYIYSSSLSASPNAFFDSGSNYSHSTGTGDYYLIARACDRSGNCTSKTSNVFKLDNTVPTITFGTNGNSSWSKTASSSIIVTDNHSQGDTATYKYIYSASSETPNNSFTSGSSYSQTTGSGDYYLIARACDNAGNCKTETSNSFKLDNEAPSFPEITMGSYVEDSWTNGNVLMSYPANDSKVEGVYYQYSHSGAFDSNSSTRSESSWTISWTGYYIYYIRACDALGNCSDADSVKIKVDKDSPSISSTSTSECSSNKRTITINASDPNVGSTLNTANVGSGVKGYAITSSTTTPSVSSFNSITDSSWTSTDYSPGTYYAWVKDDAGNISSYSTVSVEACDSEGPVITFGTDGSSSYLAQASTTLTVTDASPISSIEYGWSTSNTSTSAETSTTSGSTLNSKCSRTTDGDCYLYVKACDTYNNCTEQRTSAFKLDVTAPTITITEYYACAKGLHEEYTMSDSGSGVAQYGKIHCDLNLGADSCYGYITGSRINTITATSSKSISSEWTTCNTSGSEQPMGTTGCAFWVKAFDAVGNMSKQNTTQNLKAFSSTVACPDCP